MRVESLNQDLLKQFTDWLVGEEHSPLTTSAYTAELERLATWAAPSLLSDLEPAQLTAYLKRGRRRGDTRATRNVRLAAMRKFWGWLVSIGVVEQNAALDIPILRVTRTGVEHLSRGAVRALLTALHGHVRDTSIFLLVLTTGVQVRELVPMDRQDVTPVREGVAIEVRGADPVRTVYPSRQAEHSLDEYIDLREDDEPALFVSRRRRRIAARTIQSAFARHFRRARVAGSLRSVRHTFAVHRTQAGMRARQLQDLMGYKTLLSTEVYQEAVPADLQEAARMTEERY
jgi:site-specific recombinase XerD